MFPTRFKGRISHKLSYPVTAKEISDALADVPQSPQLTIEFYGRWRQLLESKNPHLLKMVSFDTGRQYAVLEVSFGFRSKKLPDNGVVFERAWQIVIRPVPRILRHAINQLLKKQAFPAVRRWLFERSNLSSSHGVQTLTAIYDEGKEELRLEHFQSPGETFQFGR